MSLSFSNVMAPGGASRDVDKPLVTQESNTFWEFHGLIQQPKGTKFTLSIWNSTLLVATTLASLAPPALLIYLWSMSIHAMRGEASESLWYEIVSSGWLERTITLSTQVVRLAAVWQASLCMRMLISLLLERSKVPLSSLPGFSIMRAGSPTAIDFLWNATLPDSRNGLHWFIAVVVLMTTTVLQFASTILLSDIGPIRTSVGRQTVDAPTAFNRHTGSYYNRLESFPLFAEYHERNNSAENYQDTGTTIRALLPFENIVSREALRGYSGFAPIIAPRTICTRPTLDATINVDFRGVQIVGGIKVDFASLPEAIQSSGDLSSFSNPVECFFGSYASDEYREFPRAVQEWHLSFCRFDWRSTQSVGIEGSITGAKTYSSQFLILNRTLESGSVGVRTGSYNIDGSWSRRANGPWASYRHQNSPSFGFDATVCFISLEAGSSNVEMYRDTPVSEPRLVWDKNRRDWDTSLARSLYSQYGHNQTLTSLSLKPKNWTDSIDPSGTSNFRILGTNASTNLTWTLCGYCTAPEHIEIFKAHAAVAQDMLKLTGNVAIMAQTLLTIIAQANYYEGLFENLNTTAAVISVYQSLQVPVRWRGIIIVVTTLVLHLVIVLVVSIGFLCLTTMPFLGDSWQAVAQASRGETESVISNLGEMTDSDVEKSLRRRNINKQVGLARNLDSQTIEVVSR
ncbi:hypothetical protein TWF281_011735 [Arthrobotrys megalospora]